MGESGQVRASALDEHAATRRLLDRLAFGGRLDEVAAAQARGFDATLATLVTPGPDAGAAATPPPAFDYVDVSTRGLSEAAKHDGYALISSQQRQLAAWWMSRMAATQQPLIERLTWFWHGHFATSDTGVNDPRFMLRQNETLRTLGLGNFGDLTRAIVVDPAMLLWLNGNENRRTAPNENLGRELMELFTLGVGTYSETDVKQAARALTGWSVDRPTVTATLNARQQDTGPKTVLGVTGNLDADALVDTLIGTDASARFVTGRMWFRFVSPDPPDPSTSADVVTTYGPGRDIRAAIRALAGSPAFRDPTNTLVKSPVEWTVGLMRALDVPTTPEPGGTVDKAIDSLTLLGQVPFRPPNVGGWSAGPAWLTPTAGLRRFGLAQRLATAAKVPAAPTSASARIEWARQVLSVDAWSPRTSAALEPVTADPSQLLAVAAGSPEYVVSG